MEKAKINKEDVIASFNLSYNNIVSLFVQYYQDNLDKIKEQENFESINSAFKMLSNGNAKTATRKLYAETNSDGEENFIIPIAIIEKGMSEPLISFKVRNEDVSIMHMQNLSKNHNDILDELVEKCESIYDGDYELVCETMIDSDYYNDIDKLDHSNNHSQKPFYILYQINKKQGERNGI
jgi:hypothetical protein